VTPALRPPLRPGAARRRAPPPPRPKRPAPFAWAAVAPFPAPRLYDQDGVGPHSHFLEEATTAGCAHLFVRGADETNPAEGIPAERTKRLDGVDRGEDAALHIADAWTQRSPPLDAKRALRRRPGGEDRVQVREEHHIPFPLPRKRRSEAVAIHAAVVNGQLRTPLGAARPHPGTDPLYVVAIVSA